jgi:hypothetical protein
MEIDFESINEEIILEKEFSMSVPEKMLAKSIDLQPFIEASEKFDIVDMESAKNCLSMSLQARKMRKLLDKTRTDIIKPHLEFQRSVNKFAKKFEEKLSEIEKTLSEKLREFVKSNHDCGYMSSITEILRVQDGQASKKLSWIFEVEDIDQVPREFLCIDEKKVEASIKAGIRSILGLRIHENLDLSIRVKN